jgi:hypothetical protein
MSKGTAIIRVTFDNRSVRMEGVRITVVAELMSMWAQRERHRGQKFRLMPAGHPDRAVDVSIDTLTELTVSRA